jgi:hypothetical protein
VFSTRDGKPLGHGNVLHAFVKAAEAVKLNPRASGRSCSTTAAGRSPRRSSPPGLTWSRSAASSGTPTRPSRSGASAEEFANARHADALRDLLDAAFRLRPLASA